jgi:hypothetical protein
MILVIYAVNEMGAHGPGGAYVKGAKLNYGVNVYTLGIGQSDMDYGGGLPRAWLSMIHHLYAKVVRDALAHCLSWTSVRMPVWYEVKAESAICIPCLLKADKVGCLAGVCCNEKCRRLLLSKVTGPPRGLLCQIRHIPSLSLKHRHVAFLKCTSVFETGFHGYQAPCGILHSDHCQYEFRALRKALK